MVGHGVHTQLVVRVTVVQVVTPLVAQEPPVSLEQGMVVVAEMETMGQAEQAEFHLEVAVEEQEQEFPQAQVAQAVEAR